MFPHNNNKILLSYYSGVGILDISDISAPKIIAEYSNPDIKALRGKELTMKENEKHIYQFITGGYIIIYEYNDEKKQVNLLGKHDFTLAFTGKFTKKYPDILFAISNTKGLVLYDTSDITLKEIT